MFWFASFCHLYIRGYFVFYIDMFQTITEKIEVAGVYQKAMFTPKRFLWRHKIYTIQQVTLISDLRDGQVRKRLYSVLALGTLYRLMFNRETEHWTLEEIWYE